MCEYRCVIVHRRAVCRGVRRRCVHEVFHVLNVAAFSGAYILSGAVEVISAAGSCRERAVYSLRFGLCQGHILRRNARGNSLPRVIFLIGGGICQRIFIRVRADILVHKPQRLEIFNDPAHIGGSACLILFCRLAEPVCRGLLPRDIIADGAGAGSGDDFKDVER